MRSGPGAGRDVREWETDILCASEPDGLAAGAGALPRARRRCEAGKRTHGPGQRACLALLAATALLALAAPAQAQPTTVTQSGEGATWSLVGENTVAAGQQTYTYTLTRTSGSRPQNEYFGFTSDTLEAERFQDGYSDCTGTNYFCFTLSNSFSYSEYTVSNVRFAGKILRDTSTQHVLTLKVATGTPTGTTVTLGVVSRSGIPRSGGLQITVVTAPTNTAPTVANTIPNQTATAGTAFSYAFLANTFADTDPGDTLTYTATQSDDTALPSWLSFAAATRTFSGTPTAADVGTVSVKVTASDGHGGSVSDTFDIVVSAAGVTVSTSALTVTEEDTTGNTYTVVLDTRPTANVTVTVAGHGGTDVTLTPSTLTFTTANWNLAQTVTVKAGNDTDTTNDTVTLTHSAASTDSNYGGITIGSVVVTVADNDSLTAPGAPTGLAATANGPSQIDLAWTAPATTGGSAITGYKIEVSPDGSSWSALVADTASTDTAYAHVGLDPATTRHYRVSAINAVGTSDASDSDDTTTASTNTAATGAPTITGTAQVGQTLTAVTTGITDADGLTSPTYTYQWIRVDGTDEEDISGENSSTYTLVDADLGTTLKVRVTFDDDAGNTETRTSVATATVTPAAGAPNPPTNLSVTVGVGQVVLVWQHPSGGGSRSHYEYRSSPGDMIAPDAMWQQVQSSSTRPIQSYSQVVKGLTNDTTHTFQVRAANAQGRSAPATVTATPLSQPSCTIDALGDRRRLWQSQLTAGILEIRTDGRIQTGYGDGGTDFGTLTPAAFTFRSTSYFVYPRTAGDLLTVVLRDPDFDLWSPREEVVDALRLHVCNTPYDFSSAAVPDFFSEFEGYQWNVGFNWPPGIERTLRLSLPPNHPATGDPVISGTVQVGAELTALTDGIMDDDVLDDVFTYQWVRVDADGTSNEEDITDETDATYTLTADERGKQVKVEVRFVDILGGEETRTSAPTATLAGVPNITATGAPTITGTAQVGQTLTAVTTGIMDADGLTSPTYTYQWIRVDGTEADIASANSSTYLLVAADLGTTLKVRVTFADDLGHTETLTSAATATVTATPVTTPGAPTGLAATATGPSQIDLSWSAPASTGGSAITGYKIEVSPDGSSWSDLVADTASTDTAYATRGARPRHHPPLPRLRHQHQRRRRPLQRRQRHHRHHRARRSDRAHGHGQRDHRDQPLLERPGARGAAITGYKIEVSPDGSSWSALVADTASTDTASPTWGSTPPPPATTNTNGAGDPSNVDSATTGTTVPGRLRPGSRPRPAGPPAINLSWPARSPAAPPSPATRSRSPTGLRPRPRQ